jgi:hypothetical protein
MIMLIRDVLCMSNCWRCEHIRIEKSPRLTLVAYFCDKSHEYQHDEHDCPDFEGEPGTDEADYESNPETK